MAIYRNIQMSFWTDSKVVDDFTPEDRYFYLYLMTNPHTNLAGCYEISLKQASDETGYTKDVIANLLERFERVHNVIRYSKDTKEVLLLHWGKFNWTASEKFRKPLLSEIEDVKSNDFKAYLMNEFNGEDTVSIPYPYGSDTTVTDTVTDTVSDTDSITVADKGRRGARAKPKGNLHSNPSLRPTLDEVRTYISEKGYSVDAETFFNYFTEGEWLDSKGEPVKNWKQKVITWAKRSGGATARPRQSSRRELFARLYEEHKDDI